MAELHAALRDGRHDAFEALHEGYAQSIYNLALRIVDDREDARDVTQDVLIKAFRTLPREDDHVDLTAWLYRVTVNASLDHLRSRRRRPLVSSTEDVEPIAPVDEFEKADLVTRVEAALRALPVRQRIALLLRDVRGLSVSETAVALGVTRGSAGVLLSRARAGFRRVYLAGSQAVAVDAGCRYAAEALGDDGAGDLSRRRAVFEHAETCPSCRRTIDSWAVTPAALASLVPLIPLPQGLTVDIVSAAAWGSRGSAIAFHVARLSETLAGAAARIGEVGSLKVVAAVAVAAVAVGGAGIAARELPGAEGDRGAAASAVAAAVSDPSARAGRAASDAGATPERVRVAARSRVRRAHAAEGSVGGASSGAVNAVATRAGRSDGLGGSASGGSAGATTGAASGGTRSSGCGAASSGSGACAAGVGAGTVESGGGGSGAAGESGRDSSSR